MKEKITPEIEKQIVEFYKEHNTLYGLEKEVDVTIPRLYRRLNKLGIKPNGKGRIKKFSEIVCYRCKESKSLDNYYTDKSRRTGYAYVCKDCYKVDRRDYCRNKCYVDDLFKLKRRIRSLIVYSFSAKKTNKVSTTEIILGCSFQEFKLYLESQFEHWMTWENYGKFNGTPNFGWDIDHIIPVSSAQNREELIKLNHHTNMRPLCSYVNRYVKRNKIIEGGTNT